MVLFFQKKIGRAVNGLWVRYHSGGVGSRQDGVAVRGQLTHAVIVGMHLVVEYRVICMVLMRF